MVSDLIFQFLDSHHYYATIVLLSQKLHYQNEYYRTIAYNCEYTVLMKDRRKASIDRFAKQISPYNIEFPIAAYRRSTQRPYTYLLFDASQNGPEIAELR